jgi:hypothetical protein
MGLVDGLAIGKGHNIISVNGQLSAVESDRRVNGSSELIASERQFRDAKSAFSIVFEVGMTINSREKQLGI